MMTDEALAELIELMGKIEKHAKRVALVATVALVGAVIENCAGFLMML